MRDFNYNDLEALQQLDGACDSTSEEEAEEVEVGAGADEDEFLGMINAEALKALQEAEGSSEDNGSSSDSDALDDAVEEVEEVSTWRGGMGVKDLHDSTPPQMISDFPQPHFCIPAVRSR